MSSYSIRKKEWLQSDAGVSTLQSIDNEGTAPGVAPGPLERYTPLADQMQFGCSSETALQRPLRVPRKYARGLTRVPGQLPSSTGATEKNRWHARSIIRPVISPVPVLI